MDFSEPGPARKAPGSMEDMQAMAAPETRPGECHLDMHCCRGEHRPLNAVTCLLRLPFVMFELDLCHVKLLAGNLYTAATTSLLKRCVRNMGSCHECVFTSEAVRTSALCKRVNSQGPPNCTDRSTHRMVSSVE